MSRRPDWAEYEPSVDQIEAQATRLIDNNAESWYEWDALVTDDSDRESCEYFGQISSLELRQLQYDPAATAEQCKAACMELRRRFIDARLEQIQEAAIKQAQEDAEEADFERRFCA